MSWRGNSFRIAVTLWGESTYHWWIPLTKKQWSRALAFLFCFWWNKLLTKQSSSQWFEMPWCCSICEVTVMLLARLVLKQEYSVRNISWYHGCWCSGNLRRQVINSHGIHCEVYMGLNLPWGKNYQKKKISGNGFNMKSVHKNTYQSTWHQLSINVHMNCKWQFDWFSEKEYWNDGMNT